MEEQYKCVHLNPQIGEKIGKLCFGQNCPSPQTTIFFFFLVLDKISFSSLNYYESYLFVPKLSEVCFLSLNFAKRYDFHHSIHGC